MQNANDSVLLGCFPPMSRRGCTVAIHSKSLDLVAAAPQFWVSKSSKREFSRRFNPDERGFVVGLLWTCLSQHFISHRLCCFVLQASHYAPGGIERCNNTFAEFIIDIYNLKCNIPRQRGGLAQLVERPLRIVQQICGRSLVRFLHSPLVFVEITLFCLCLKAKLFCTFGAL